MTETEYPLLATKLFVPKPRPDSVQRIRLLNRLNSGIHRRLTLISAPAGFGKTTLLGEWISGSHIPVSWISLDKDDNDPYQFLHYLVASFREVTPGIGDAALSLLQYPQQSDIGVILNNLIKEITDDPTGQILVFDDYHAIDSEKVHRMVGALLDYLPREVHIAIATRVDPPLSLARLRASGDLSELRTVDLCFTVDETTAFLNKVMGLNLSEGDIRVLESRTEGWIAGLQLAAISMQGRDDMSSFIHSFAGDDRHIVDYMVEEVLEIQPGPIQDFLLQTSILTRLSEPLCDFVINTTGSQEILDQLEASNLFLMPLDNKRQWYRYHHLFADLLQQRLQRGDRDRVDDLHLRASDWHEKNGFIHEAINHALRAENHERAAILIKPLINRSWDYDTRILGWHNQLPPEFVHRDAELCFFSAWMLFEDGLYESSEKRLDIAESLVRRPAGDDGRAQTEAERMQAPDTVELLGKIAAIRACIAYFKGQMPETFRLAEKARQYLYECHSSWRNLPDYILGLVHHARGETKKAIRKYRDAAKVNDVSGEYYIHLQASIRLVEFLRDEGDLTGAIKAYEALYKSTQERGLSHSRMMGWLYCNWGEVLSDLHQFPEAMRFVQESLELSLQMNEMSFMGKCFCSMGKVLIAKGDLAGAEAIIQKAVGISRKSTLPLQSLDHLNALQVRIWLKKGELEPAVEWMERRQAAENRTFNFLSESEQVLYAQILFARGDPEEALKNLQPLKKTPDVLLLQATIFKSQGRRSDAIRALKQAVLLTEPGGMIARYVDGGQPIADLLQQLLDEDPDIPRAYVNRLLSAFRLQRAIPVENEGLIDPLSERELEVLRFIAAGLSNKEIMAALFISLSTVKTHLRNIYSKLGVNSRTQATAKAKELQLL
ncbi:MAG: LuxR C-terminal-related transcriptional regulator [bacterium]